MPSSLKNLLLLAAAFLALAAGYWLASSQRTPESVTKPTYGGGEAIEFTLPDLDGKNRRLNEWKGKVIVLNFWATWCPPCREEIPLFIDLQKRRAAEGVQLIGLAIDNQEAVAAYQKSAGINYPLLIGGEDAGMELIGRYGNRMGSLPFTAIIDRNGAIVARKLGAFDRAELESLIDPLLAPKQASTPLPR
jgi:thiol-disulfide isomerase/thioredoxin